MKDRQTLTGKNAVGGAGWCDHCCHWMPAGPDHCLGYLRNVRWACCGHGDPKSAYVVLVGEPHQAGADGALPVYGEKALEYFRYVGRTAESPVEED